MSAISQLLTAQFWPNFKCRFLGPSWTDSNCPGDICPGNICPGNICSYQENLSCYLPDLTNIFWIRQWLSRAFHPRFPKKMVIAILDPSKSRTTSWKGTSPNRKSLVIYFFCSDIILIIQWKWYNFSVVIQCFLWYNVGDTMFVI